MPPRSFPCLLSEVHEIQIFATLLLGVSTLAIGNIRKEGDTWIAENECTFSGIHVVSYSETTVRSDDSIHSKRQSTYGAGKAEITIVDQKYLGACEADQKVGVPIVAK